MDKDQELIKAIIRGDEAAFRKLYDVYRDRVYNTALTYVQNESDAEEVTQDAFTNIYRKAATFKAEASVSTWVYRITVNLALNTLKRKKRYTVFKLNYGPGPSTDFVHPGVQLENKESAKTLFRTIHSLGDQQKTTFILSYIENLPRQEVADIMGISLKAVESSLQRAKKKLRQALAKEYPYRIKN